MHISFTQSESRITPSAATRSLALLLLEIEHIDFEEWNGDLEEHLNRINPR
jgi:hypothetical protein